MENAEILAHRLSGQSLLGAPLASPQAVVRRLGVVQAQDFYGAKWAVGQRCAADDATVEAAFNAGLLLRTHLCRPTWHFVAPQDIRWLLELTAPRVHHASAFMNRKLGLDAKRLKKATDLIARALEGGKHLRRDALMEGLRRARLDTSEFRPAHFMMYAELEGVVCSGPRQGTQFTYALLDERVPSTPRLHREEALAELASRYLTTRGPASVQDFAWWSGLTAVDAKKGIAAVRERFVPVRINGREQWQAKDAVAPRIRADTVHLLPNYDEYGIGYKDRSAFHDPDQAKRSGSRGNPVFNNLIVVEGRVLGTWARTLGKGRVQVMLAPFDPLPAKVMKALYAAATRYGAFLGLRAEVTP